MPDPRKIIYLPYLPINERFTFGRVGFEKFSAFKSQIQDEAIKNHLEWFFGKFKIRLVTEPRDVTIATTNSDGALQNDEVDLVQKAAQTLFALTIPNNDGLVCALSSENFQVYVYQFQAGTRTLRIERGGYIHQDRMMAEDYTEGLQFLWPEHISDRIFGSPWQQNQSLFEALNAATSNHGGQVWFNQILRSSEIMGAACSNLEQIKYFDRIVLLCTAFETLLKSQEEPTEGQERFARAIVKFSGFSEQETGSDASLEYLNESLKTFAMELYSIRSRYSHGNEMSSSDIRSNRFGEYFATGLKIWLEAIGGVLSLQELYQRPHSVARSLFLNIILFPSNTS